MSADLHIHTTASDGRLAPELIVAAALEAGLTHIAITDHDTVDGLLALGKERTTTGKVVVIPGIEFSTDLPENEVHILGYYIDILHPALAKELKAITDDRLLRAERMVAKLEKLGYPISFNRVVDLADEATAIGRPHIAAALVEKAYFPSVREVFAKLLEKGKPAYIPHYKLTPAETIDLIKGAGGIPVLAHPGLVGDDRIVAEIIKQGVAGIEVYHPRHTQADTTKYEAVAAEYKLLLTGGSDYHGIAGRWPHRLGEFSVPKALAQRLTVVARH